MSYSRVVLGLRREGRRRALWVDERPKMPDWIAALERRGLGRARRSRDEAVAVLEGYAGSGGYDL